MDFEIKMPEHFAYDVYATLMNINNGDTYNFSITAANGYTDRAWVEPGDYKLMQVYVHGDNIGAYPFVWDANVITVAANESYKFTPEFMKYDEITQEIEDAYKEREEIYGIDKEGNITLSEDGKEVVGIEDSFDFDKTTTPVMTQSRENSGKIWVLGETDSTYNLKIEIAEIDTAVLPTRVDEAGNVVPDYPEVPGIYFKIAKNDTYQNFSVYIDGEPVTTEVYNVPLSGYYELNSDITLYFDTEAGDFQVGDTFTYYILSTEYVVIQKYEGSGSTEWTVTPKNGKALFDALCDNDVNMVIRIEKSGGVGTAVWSISEDGGETFGEQEYAKDVLEYEDFTITFTNKNSNHLFTKGGKYTLTYEKPEVNLGFSGSSIVALIFVLALVGGGFVFVNKKMKDNMPKDSQYTINK